MAKLSSKFTSISPGMTTDNATDYLVSTMKAYGIEVDEVERKILDNVNRIGNTFATTNAEIGEMLTRSSAAMHAANNSLEETIALESAAVQITRNAETTGTTFRTVSMRIRGLDEETEEELEDYEELKGKIADLTKTKDTPGGITLFTDESKTEFKSTYQLLKDISKIWDQITDKNQAALLEAIGGKRGAQSLAGILENFDEVERAMGEMESAAGSADAEMDIIRDSIGFKINELKQTWVGVLQNITDRGGLGKLLDVLNNISEALGDIVSKAGLLKTAFVSIATVIGSKKLGLFNTKDSGTLLGAIAQTHNTKKELSGYEDDIDTYKKVIEHLQQSSDSKAFFNMDIDSMENTSDRVKEKLKEIKDIADETKDSSSDIIERINDEIGNVETSIDETSKKTTALGNSIKGFFKGLLNGLISMGASMLLSWGISEGIKAIDKLINKSKYIQQAAKKARDAISSIKTELDNTSKSVDETKQRYAELAQEVNHLGTVAQSQGTLSNDEYKEFLDLSNQLSELFPTLTQGYDDNGNAILKLSGDVDTIVGSLERLVEVEREAANAEIGKKMPKVWAGFVDEIKNESDNLEIATKILEAVKDQDFSLGTGKLTNYNSDTRALSQAAEISGVKINLDKAMDEYDTTGIIDLSYLEMADREKLAAAFKVIENNWDRQVRNHEAVIESKSKEMYDYLITQFVDDDNYKNLSEEQQKIFNGLLLNRDYKSLAKKFGDNYEAAFNEIQTQINTIMDKMPEGSDNQKKFQDYYEKIFSIDTSEGVFAENIEQIKQYIQELADLLGIEYIDLAEIFGLSDIDADLKSVKDRFIVDNSSGSSKSTYDVNKILKELSKGGNVDLTNRPKVNTAYLNNAGWKDVGQGYATVYSSTFGNEEGTEYINFTPIIVDPETGEFKGVLTPEELTEYAEGVIAGTREDDLNLQIGASFDTVEAAEKAAEEIHRYHELINGGDYSSETNLGYISFDPRKQKAEQEAKKEYDAFIDSLSKEDFDFWKNALDNGQIPQEVLHNGEAALKEYLKKLQEVTKKNPIEIKASAAVDSMASAKQAINSLDELYNQVVKMEEKDGQVTGFADPTLINNVESGFKDFIKEASESGKDVTELNSALEEFERIMIEQPNDAEAASKAMDDLITAYIDQTDIIKNLTEENAEWSIKQLEVMGIENAEKVVKTRLSKASKKVSEAISKLNGVLVENAKVLKESKKGSDEYIKALESIKDSLKKALSIYDKDGEATFTPEINDEFVERYLDDINKMADGDVEALNKVRQAAAKEAFLRVNVSIPTEVAEMQAGQLMDIIGQVEDRNIEVGAYIDDAPFLDSLAEMMRSSDQTADAVAAAFQSMGYEVEWVPRPYTVEYVKANQSNIKDTKAYQAMLETAKAKVDVPALRIKRSGSAGAGAHYTGGSSSSSDSSSGGGGGGSEPTQPKDDTEETFDWIEVAIQRIEEEMARLDKIVGNSYIKWSDRNSALTDEINKTTEAIKAQELAEEEYYRNANELQVNDGKGLNDDDYGENDYLVKEHDQKLLDEAREIWATGEYQEKVKNGLLTGDDIEKIQNKYLVETIKTYQEWINKGIAAGDAADDLRIKLGDLARTSFDHVKDEYDELIAFVTGSADIIDEKINRTEKKGYFVDKAYYHDLMALEEENYNYLAKKRDEMIKKRDEAVAAGYIEENSSEWNKMSQEIDGVTLAIEQSETKMVEYNNTLRQLDWDMFDWIEDRISRINSEAAFLVDLMSEERLVDDNGVFTAQGEATNAMYAVKYETYMRQARDYAEERKKIEADLINDPGNKELIKRREELIDLEQESIKNAQQEKEAIKSLVQEAINKAIESLQKLIDKQKTAIREAKDLYDYQKNIANQVKNIGNIRKQLAAYAGDDSEENRARVQKLQQQLEEAEQQLQETEWDKYISETEKFLDDMMDDYSETLNKKLEDIDSLIEEMIQHANNNADTVAQTIQDETDKVGYTLTDEFSNIISGGRDQMVTDLQSAADNITTAITNVQTVIESIKEYVAEMAEYGKKTEEVKSSGGSSKSDSDSGSDKKSDDSKKSDGGKKSDEGKKDEGSKGSGTNRKLTDKDYYGVALAIINGNYGWGTGEDMDSKLKAKGFDVNRVRDIINKLYAEGYIHSGAWVGRYQGITDLSPYAFNKYAKGSKRISSDQLAWTQEKGQELIFRSSDGAMLTPLNAGDKVFTAQMTDNLWELAKGRFTTNIPKSAKGNTINNSNAISITLPNVKNYEEFKTALQNDPKMTSFIQQITLGEISNGIKLNKKKY